MAQKTLDVHVAAWPPSRWDEIDEIRRGSNPNAFPNTQRPPITSEAIDWLAFDFVPRWVGDDSSEAVVALEPSMFHDRGAAEWRRFIAGTRARGELALAVSMVGDAEEPAYRSIFGPSASVTIPGADGSSVGGSRLALASPPEPPEDLGRADRDLALRLVDPGVRPTELPWWSLELSDELGYRGGLILETTQIGTLVPLLISRVGEVVAAIWISPDGSIRHYILPYLLAYSPVLQWLTDQAIPEFVPTAARRRGWALADQAEFQTPGEAALRAEIDNLEADYERRHARLLSMASSATAEVDGVRVPLLYESGSVLVAAVRRILEDAGLAVEDVDELLDGTPNADLLASWADRSRLIEIKGVTGNPSERLVEAPSRHLATWPELCPDLAVEGVTLVINYQIRTHPLDRWPQPYVRSEFVATLTFPVISTLELFDFWRLGDHSAIRSAIFSL